MFDLSARPEKMSITISLPIFSLSANIFSLSSLSLTVSLSSLEIFLKCFDSGRIMKVYLHFKTRLNFSFSWSCDTHLTFFYLIIFWTKEVFPQSVFPTTKMLPSNFPRSTNLSSFCIKTSKNLRWNILSKYVLLY